MKKYRLERKGRRSFDTATQYNAVSLVARERTRTAESAVRATRYSGKLAKVTPM